MIVYISASHTGTAVAIYHFCGLGPFGRRNALSALAWRYCVPLKVASLQHEVVWRKGRIRRRLGNHRRRTSAPRRLAAHANAMPTSPLRWGIPWIFPRIMGCSSGIKRPCHGYAYRLRRAVVKLSHHMRSWRILVLADAIDEWLSICPCHHRGQISVLPQKMQLARGRS